MKKQLINLDAKPFVPEGWVVGTHQKGGKWEWNSDEVKLYLHGMQLNGKYIKGMHLRDELKELDKKVLNANVLDYLLKNPTLIPDEWKTKYVFFWGTVYRFSDGDLYVRYLCWIDGAWNWSISWLDDEFSSYDPAAVRASTLRSDTKTSSDTLSFERRLKEIETWKQKVEKVLNV